jgi:uncharacterized protein (UPF0332 family)
MELSRARPFLDKARESLLGAESELANGRYNNAANRAYYAVYQAAVAALTAAGLQRPEWYHDQVQAAFAGELIRRRKLYPAQLRSVIYDLYDLRIVADYASSHVSHPRCQRAVRRAEEMVTSVEARVLR